MPDYYHQSIEFVLEHEGFYTVDHAGATKYGISLRFLKNLTNSKIDPDINGDGHVDHFDIKELSLEQAKVLYREHFWDHYKLQFVRNPLIAERMLSFFVNMRGRVAGKLVQRALKAAGVPVAIDGIIGPKTLDAINAFYHEPLILVAAIRAEAAGIYRLIAQKDPDMSKYLAGWLNRAYS